ncbi:MAG TPA: flagellar hook-associated protein FlgK [Pyrinomonadaceae bacterium]|nr:flagellar hook-associated protein FlgK [Pyrinomonadaceae bacterium]
MSLNFSPFEIGRRALNAQQFGINITGQNIANVNTPGYSRQRVVLAESLPANFSRYSVGTGVDVKSVQDFRDRFIESRLQTEVGISGTLNGRRDVMANVEVALQGSETGGLQNALNGFFGAWRDLDANPNSVPLRSIVAQKAAALTGSFHTTSSRLQEIRFGADQDIRTTVDTVNSLTSKIAELNGQVAVAEGIGSNASGLKDQRQELVNQLTELTGARSTTNGDGTINLTIGEGKPLVNGTFATSLSAESTPPLGLAVVKIGKTLATFDEGKIKGLQDAIGETTKNLNLLDGLAGEVAARVNNLHTSGTDLDNNPGVEFFNTSVPVTAANISINPAITTNSRLIVSSALTQPGQSGTIAGAISNLLTDQGSNVGGRTGSFSSIYGSMLSDAGQYVSNAENDLQTQGYIIAQVTAQREAVSGVSLDEEAINLMQYQKAFDAAAKFLKVADEMTQTILSLGN